MTAASSKVLWLTAVAVAVLVLRRVCTSVILVVLAVLVLVVEVLLTVVAAAAAAAAIRAARPATRTRSPASYPQHIAAAAFTVLFDAQQLLRSKLWVNM